MGSFTRICPIRIGACGIAVVVVFSQEVNSHETIPPPVAEFGFAVPANPENGSTESRKPSDEVEGVSSEANPLSAIPLSSLTSTQERPIFQPSRRPPAAPVTMKPASFAPPPPENSDPRRPRLALLGAIVSGSESIGIFLDETTKRVVRLKQGESHMGWRLTEVTRRQATLQRGSEITIKDLLLP